MVREPNPEIVKAAMDEFWTQLRSEDEFKNLTDYEMALCFYQKGLENNTLITFYDFKRIIEGGCPTHGLFLEMLSKLLGICVKRGDYCPTVYRNLLEELYNCEYWQVYATNRSLLRIDEKLSKIIELLKK